MEKYHMRYSRARNLALFTKIARLDDDINRRLGIGGKNPNEPAPLFMSPLEAQINNLIGLKGPMSGRIARMGDGAPSKLQDAFMADIINKRSGPGQLDFTALLGNTKNDMSLLDLDPTVLQTYAQATGAIPRGIPFGEGNVGEQLSLDLDAKQGLLAKVTDALSGKASRAGRALSRAGSTALDTLGGAGSSLAHSLGGAGSSLAHSLGGAGSRAAAALASPAATAKLLLGYDPSVGAGGGGGGGGIGGGGPDFDVSGLNFSGILDGMGSKVGKGLGIAALLAAAGYGGKKYYDKMQSDRLLADTRAREEEAAKAALLAAQLSAEKRRKLMRNLGIGAAATAGLGLGAYGYSRRRRSED
jgi:hypothetical protein